MLFASTELAARVERAECRLLTDSAAAAARRHPAADVFVLNVAGGVATHLSAAQSPLNKVAGVGFAGELAAAELAQVERTFFERGTPVQVELSNLASPAVGRFLTQRGYVLEGFENVLGRRLPADPRPPVPEVEVSPSDDRELDTWTDVVVTGFATPDTQGIVSHESYPRDVIEQAIADVSSGKGFMRYLARRSGEPAGGGSMRVFEGIAQLCGAATLPEHRRRGVQSALLDKRLADATAAGCDVAVVTTQPGSKSHENVQRQGFALLYTRAILVRSA